MGILDSNISRTTGLSSLSSLFTDRTAIAAYQDNLIDVKKYNSIVISFKSTTATSRVQVVGYRNSNEPDLNIAGIEITNHESLGVFAKKQIADVPTTYTRVFVFDCSALTHIGIGKTTEDGSLTVRYNLKQEYVNDVLVEDGYYKSRLKNGVTILNEAKTGIDVTGVKKNALLLRINTTAVLSMLPFYKKVNGVAKNITSNCYNYDRKMFCGTRDNYPVGDNNIVVPIENAEIIYTYLSSLNGATVNIDYKFIDFDFNKIGKLFSYWDNQNIAIGNVTNLEVPTIANSCEVIVSGNTTSNGMSVEMRGIKRGNTVAKTINNIQVSESEQRFIADCSDLSSISFGTSDVLSGISIQVIFSDRIIEKSNFNIRKITENGLFSLSKVEGMRQNVSLLRDIAVFWSSNSIAISRSGIAGEQTIINLGTASFKNLIENSLIERVIILPWTRNGSISAGYHGQDWRINVITTKGQIYHNFPSRAIGADGNENADGLDYTRFDESVVWDLETRKHPVKTNTGNDATLISTGKYMYYPALPDEAYEFHPAVNVSDYGNGGFPAVSEQTQADNTEIKFSRYYFTDRSRGYNANPLGFMGGFVADNKISALATYKTNTESAGATRMCLFLTNDGGRQWYCRYEIGSKGELIDENRTRIKTPEPIFLPRNLVAVGMSANAGSELYNIIKRRQYTPSDINKEPELTHKFNYLTPITVQSIIAGSSDIIVTTSTAHGMNDGEVFLFEKQSGAASSEWDWIVNSEYTEMSCTGIVFKAKVINSTSFRLMEEINNPDNNITCRHIHSLNRGKDHMIMGFGEQYPHGWITYIPMVASDTFARLMPWDKLDFVRLTSTEISIQRPLGVVVEQDADNTVFIGVDNEWTDLGDVVLPVGRTATFKRSSNGVFKGKLIDVDNQALFECVFESKEVAYLFKKINGVYVYLGQQGHIGISKTGEKGTWIEANLNSSGNCHQLGTSSEGYISIDRYLIRIK